VTEKILEARARTLEGLAVQAKEIRAGVLWVQEEPTAAEYQEMDWGEANVLRFLFAVERMGAVS
jgi:hypothetical protein